MADLNGALIGFLGVMAGGFFNNFLAEDYRRFRDGQALAGALSGELESHAEPMPMIKNGLQTMLHSLSESGMQLVEWPIPSSPLFDQNASKIGLLDAETARDVAYVYENLRAFRQNFHMLSKHHRDMPKDWSSARITGCLAAITRAEGRGVPLIGCLKRQAAESYWKRPQTMTQLKYGAVIIVVFLMALKILGL